MAENNENSSEVYNNNDTFDINELASLNEDISTDLIEQLQGQISKDAQILAQNTLSTDDTELFEEIKRSSKQAPQKGTKNLNDIDDNFIKKYKAKLRKAQENVNEESVNIPHKSNTPDEPVDLETKEKISSTEQDKVDTTEEEMNSENVSKIIDNENTEKNDISIVSGGRISEKEITQETIDYNNNLDYLDNNTKYEKYVVYIDPENQEFMSSLTVKERKNLINRIIKEQDAIATTRLKWEKMQTILIHLIIAILTITISIPCLYWIVNISLETSIDNYKSSKTLFEALYKQKGKIKQNTLYSNK